MGLLDAKEYDPKPAQRRWRMIITLALIVLVPFTVWYFFFYYWPEERVVEHFFQAIERKDFETAYAIYEADPDWKQHQQKYAQYPINQFVLDWGPSGDYGPITSHHVDCALEPPKKDFVTPSGVIVVVTINGRHDTKAMWVEKKTKAVTSSYIDALCHAPR